VTVGQFEITQSVVTDVFGVLRVCKRGREDVGHGKLVWCYLGNLVYHVRLGKTAQVRTAACPAVLWPAALWLPARQQLRARHGQLLSAGLFVRELEGCRRENGYGMFLNDAGKLAFDLSVVDDSVLVPECRSLVLRGLGRGGALRLCALQ